VKWFRTLKSEKYEKGRCLYLKKDTLILGQGQYYSLDSFETRLNNNVLVVGASGAGKTRSIVTPNLLQATGSYIVSDPKGNLYDQYGPYLRKQGYEVKKLDFTDGARSEHYNFFNYIRKSQDINKIAHMIVYSSGQNGYKSDPFWDEAAELLLQSLISFLMESYDKNQRNLHNVQKLIELCHIDENDSSSKSPLDCLMEKLGKMNPESYAVKQYNKFRVAAGKTLKSILISLNARIGQYDTAEIIKLTSKDTINISGIGNRKSAVFVVVSDTDRSLDGLANLFFTQAMNELCWQADKNCKDNRLPVPVRFILDDFATNCKIAEFPRMIASIRSRGISAMLMIQAESQLMECYGYDGKTIIGNCDTYVYLGGNDIETAKAVAERCDIPLRKILYMPVETNWIFRRGQLPVNGRNFKLDDYLNEKKILSREQSEGQPQNR